MSTFSRIIVSSLILYISSVNADIERVSVSSSGAQAGGRSDSLPSISADGRFVAFGSVATNLVAGDTNHSADIFVHNRDTGLTERVSVSSSGAQGSYHSGSPSISADGRFVAFESIASNLVDGDTNSIRGFSARDIFVHDRDTGRTERVSVSSSGAQGNGHSFSPSISADGRFVAFESEANTLVDGDTNNRKDIFVHDRDTGRTERVSVSSSGAQANGSSFSPSISADGRFVAFYSQAVNLVVGDTNNRTDIFVHDRDTELTERFNVSSSGAQANGRSFSPSISADGRFVAFVSEASTLVDGDTNNSFDIFVHDRDNGHTERISVSSSGAQANGFSFFPSISADGRFVAFYSQADNLVVGDTNSRTDMFVHDRNTGHTERVSVSSSGAQVYGDSTSPSISADGRFVAFVSTASALVDGDTNNWHDIFVAENPLADSNINLINIEVLINGTARETLDDAAQLLAGTRYQVKYNVTNNSSDRLTAVQIFEDGELVCNVYGLDPGQTKQRSRCATYRTVLSGDNHVTANVTGKVAGAQTIISNTTNAYYTGIVNVTGELGVTHLINKVNADTVSQAPILDSSQTSVIFKIENTGEIELYRVYTFHDPASPVNSGWDQQCFIGTLTPGQIRYCKRDISFNNSGLHKAWGRVQGKTANVSPTGAVNAANPTYYIVP